MWWQTISSYVPLASNIATAIAAIATAVAAFFILSQARTARNAIQAQTFLRIIETARDIRFSQGMDIIRSLRYDNYEQFRESETKEVQSQVRDIVDFLNDLNHLLTEKYVTEEQVRRIYSSSIRSCAERLLPWWLKGFRDQHGGPYYYKNFEELCKRFEASA